VSIQVGDWVSIHSTHSTSVSVMIIKSLDELTEAPGYITFKKLSPVLQWHLTRETRVKL